MPGVLAMPVIHWTDMEIMFDFLADGVTKAGKKTIVALVESIALTYGALVIQNMMKEDGVGEKITGSFDLKTWDGANWTQIKDFWSQVVKLFIPTMPSSESEEYPQLINFRTHVSAVARMWMFRKTLYKVAELFWRASEVMEMLEVCFFIFIFIFYDFACARVWLCFLLIFQNKNRPTYGSRAMQVSGYLYSSVLKEKSQYFSYLYNMFAGSKKKSSGWFS